MQIVTGEDFKAAVIGYMRGDSESAAALDEYAERTHQDDAVRGIEDKDDL